MRLGAVAAVFSIPLVVFSGCATEEKFIYLSKRIDAVEAKTEKSQLSSSDRMAALNAEVGHLKEEMRLLNGRLDENSHLIKRSVERDTTKEDVLDETLVDLTRRMAQLESRVDRISTYLSLEPAPKEKNDVSPEPETAAPASGTPKADQPDKPEPVVAPDQALYDLNLEKYRKEQFEEAISGFKTFLAKYPKSKLADNAAFWVGESYMSLGQYEQAILAFQDVIKKYPQGNKVPNALLRQALAFYELKDKTSAKLLLRKVIKKYPKSSEAKIAKNKLKTIK